MRIAVVGAGISGLAAAWLLGRTHDVTLFEAADYPGGHSNTVDVTVDGLTHPVDTGFLVCNRRTYPNLCALFAHFEVPLVASDMSFSVSMEAPDIEWSGSSLATVFAQRANLARPGFWRMLQDIVRFNRETEYIAPEDSALSLGEYLMREAYSAEFADWYLLPMAAAIWSCPTAAMRDYPLATFVRFCRNHGLLQLRDRPQWLTVKGGSREYVRRLTAQLDDLRLGTPVRSITRAHGTVWLETARGVEPFHGVVLACHADQALRILGAGATQEERAVLGAIPYQRNRALLHTDTALLPRRRATWSAWNYLAGEQRDGQAPVSVSYLIDKLQPLPFRRPVVVSLNPHREPRASELIAEFDYAHPVFDLGAIEAQRRLPHLQGWQNTWFCGAWAGYGFHEDGLRAALDVANRFGEYAPWQVRAEQGALA